MKKIWCIVLNNSEGRPKHPIHIPFEKLAEFMEGIGIDGRKRIVVLETIDVLETPEEWWP